MAFPTALCTQCCLAALVITSGQKHKWQYEYSSVSQSRRFCTVLEHGLVLFLLRMVVVVHEMPSSELEVRWGTVSVLQTFLVTQCTKSCQERALELAQAMFGLLNAALSANSIPAHQHQVHISGPSCA